ncbi:MAG: 16S rRNA (adenine(1518)-N(6)/adenine(1519)-N(6))-dimethyltransferase RsmA [Candidatus Thermoplasmatota archaeon]|jgi:16S rRNA (adenine1518-N6/adenine1519-N6)-dimethyltransferase|nr:16S rRNA (adenine(1518)-N(6)/adenine(1519)-N(6))-dimethyltransferase RsmA [Candidatus Thermoplasmatota archaeon]
MKQYTKKYGQVFLRDANIRRIEVELLAPLPGEEIVEIGPGEGYLTEKLLESGAHVTCVESDHRFVDYLSARFHQYLAQGNLELIHGNFLETEIGKCSKVIGNIPYHISSPILEKLAGITFGSGVLMVQEEFARRMVAVAGDDTYSRLSVFTYLHFNARIEKIVSRNCFVPRPEVRSAIVSLKPLDRTRQLPLEFIDEKLRNLFSSKRKKIEKSIPGTAYGEMRIDQIDPEKIMDIIEFTYRNQKTGSS